MTICDKYLLWNPPLPFFQCWYPKKVPLYNHSNGETNKENKNTYYFKLPYIGDVSDKTSVKIKSLTKLFCKDLNIKLSFETCKIGSYFSTKSKSPSNLQSRVVYYFECKSCKSNYVGMTTRHCDVRIDEHLKKDKASHIYKQISNHNSCMQLNNKSSFKIIDKANNIYTLGLKEALHIKWLKPTINLQKNLINLTLTI